MEDLEELSNELEIADEDEKAPYVLIKRISGNSCLAKQSNRYEIGDTFFALPLSDVQKLLFVSTGKSTKQCRLSRTISVLFETKRNS